MTTVIVAGALANKPGNGGEAWVRLSWALGLRRLGLDVCFVEQIDAADCVDTGGLPAPVERSTNLAWFRSVTQRFDLADSSALVWDGGTSAAGIPMEELLDRVETAGLLVNISGNLRARRIVSRVRRRAYIDLDPGFTQFWHAQGVRGAQLDGHDLYYTVGTEIGSPGCPIPAHGIQWRPIRQPVVLEHWPVQEGQPSLFTTVANWRGPYGPVVTGTRRYGLKVHEFRRYVAVPQHAPGIFELALNIHPADESDRRLLLDHGWHLVDPREVVGNPERFRAYVAASGAEFSVAQGIYVETASGWFGDRSTRYLASGKPVLVQDTGFRRSLPVGEGLMAFSTMTEAVEGAMAIASDYQRHVRAARSLAEEYFDSDRVLAQLLADADVGP
jgi:hypothetical protein